MAESIALNCDCMEYMKTLPDNAFDLAVVDPPYGDAMGGDGSSRFGGMFAASISGEATRTHTHTHTARAWNRFGGRFDKYKEDRSPAQQLPQERERERETAVTRTGGTWATKYRKKS